VLVVTCESLCFCVSLYLLSFLYATERAHTTVPEHSGRTMCLSSQYK